jgi:hypothetical protein
MKLCANVYKRHNLLRLTVAFIFFDQIHVLLPMFFINFAFVKKCAFKCNSYSYVSSTPEVGVVEETFYDVFFL